MNGNKFSMERVALGPDDVAFLMASLDRKRPSRAENVSSDVFEEWAVSSQDLVMHTIKSSTDARLRKKQTICGLLILLSGIHTALSVPYLPNNILAFAGAMMIFYFNGRFFGRSSIRWYVLAIISITSVSVFSCALNGGEYLDFISRGGTFIYNITIGIAAFVAIESIGMRSTRNIFRVVAIFLVVGAALEVLGPAKPASDWFRRATLLSGLYDADIRDVTMYGGLVRPKFFASEPSILGLSIGISLFVWGCFLQKGGALDKIAYLLSAVAGFYLVRSPSILMGLGSVAFFFCISLSQKGAIQKIWFIIPILYAITAILFPIAIQYAINESIISVEYIRTGSFYARMISPFLIASAVLNDQPWFGLGLANDKGLIDYGINVYYSSGRLDVVPDYLYNTLGPNSANAFWFVFISFGLAGAVVLWLLISRLLLRLSVSTPMSYIVLTVCFTFWYSFGRVNSPLAWVTFMIAAALYKILAPISTSQESRRLAGCPLDAK